MSIDTLPKAEAENTEAIKSFRSFAEATSWMENAAQKLGESTVSTKGSKGHTYRIADEISKPENVEVAKLFKQADVEIMFERDRQETPPDFTPSFAKPPQWGGWPIKEAGGHVLMRVVDEAGGEYNLQLDKSFRDESEFFTEVNSSISYTTNQGTDLEHTTSVEVGVNQSDGQNTDDPETIAEYLKLAAGLRNAIMWKVEALAPEMQGELEDKYKRMGFVKRTLGRIAWGRSVNI